MKTQELYSKMEAAVFLGVSVRTIERMIAAGSIAKIKIRGSVRVRRKDLQAIVEGVC